MAKKKDPKNYLDYVPVLNHSFDFKIDEKGLAVISVEWTGFYHRIAQIFFRRPRVSDIHFDKYGSFVLQTIDDKKTVHELIQQVEAHFGNVENVLSRMIRFLEIMRDHRIIYWKGDSPH